MLAGADRNPNRSVVRRDIDRYPGCLPPYLGPVIGLGDWTPLGSGKALFPAEPRPQGSWRVRELPAFAASGEEDPATSRSSLSRAVLSWPSTVRPAAC